MPLVLNHSEPGAFSCRYHAGVSGGREVSESVGIARDMELSGDIATVLDPNGGLWVFRANQ